MKKLLFLSFLIPSIAWGAGAGGINLTVSPTILYKATGTWSASQTFNSSTTFNGPVTLNGGCTGCGGVGSSQNYPDWEISGTDNYNTATSNLIKVRELNVFGDAYIMNLYTEAR